jgi:hypothetical protein
MALDVQHVKGQASFGEDMAIPGRRVIGGRTLRSRIIMTKTVRLPKLDLGVTQPLALMEYHGVLSVNSDSALFRCADQFVVLGACRAPFRGNVTSSETTGAGWTSGGAPLMQHHHHLLSREVAEVLETTFSR